MERKGVRMMWMRRGSLASFATLAFSMLIGCAASNETAKVQPVRSNVARAFFPATEKELAEGISFGPDGALPYDEHWKLLWADALLFQYDSKSTPTTGSSLSSFKFFQTPETSEVLLDAALGVSCTPSDLRTKNPRHVAEAVAEVSLTYPDILDRFAEASRDSMMVLWAVADACDHRDDLAESNLLKQCLSYAGQSNLHDQWVARILYRVYSDNVPADVYQSTPEGVRELYETGRYH